MVSPCTFRRSGGPYEIRFSGSSEVTLTDVMLGEVWLCSGQSNMDGAPTTA